MGKMALERDNLIFCLVFFTKKTFLSFIVEKVSIQLTFLGGMFLQRKRWSSLLLKEWNEHFKLWIHTIVLKLWIWERGSNKLWKKFVCRSLCVKSPKFVCRWGGEVISLSNYFWGVIFGGIISRLFAFVLFSVGLVIQACGWACWIKTKKPKQTIMSTLKSKNKQVKAIRGFAPFAPRSFEQHSIIFLTRVPCAFLDRLQLN